MSLRVRERPPLGLNHIIDTPNGKRYRWAHDEPKPENAPNNVTYSSSMPGGHENWSGVLPRKPSRDYADLQELSRITTRTATGRIVSLARLETSPRVSGDSLNITPGAVGYIAALDDNQSVREIYVDADMTRWGDMPLNRKIAEAGGGLSIGDFSFANENGGLTCAFPNQALGAQTIAEAWYLTPAGVKLAKAMFVGAVTSFPTGYAGRFFTADTDSSANEVYGETLAGALETINLSPARRFLAQQVWSAGNAVTPAAGANLRFSAISVYGDHGLTTHAIDASTPDGLLASDVVAHAIGKWCPELAFTTGPDGTIQPSTFLIPHLIFPDLGTVTPIVQGATRFELQDYAVWSDTRGQPTFYMNDYGARGRKWSAYVGPTGLNETGPQVDRIWNSVVVQFTDTGGITRYVGPVGSGADVEDASLTDADPLNPATLAGITRRALVQMNGVSTPTGAIKVGATYLQYQKVHNTSGQAKLIGHVLDDHGVYYPAAEVMAGDSISFLDAADTSPRRITHATYTDNDKTCLIDLDSPPESMQALLERLDARLVTIGQAA